MDLEYWISQPDVCRCCLAASGTRDVTSTFISDAGCHEVYSDMIQECFGISLSYVEERGPSRMMCRLCVEHLRDANNFRHQLLQAEEYFHDYYKDETDYFHIETEFGSVKSENSESSSVNLDESTEYLDEEFLNDKDLSITEQLSEDDNILKNNFVDKPTHIQKNPPDKDEIVPKPTSETINIINTSQVFNRKETLRNRDKGELDASKTGLKNNKPNNVCDKVENNVTERNFGLRKKEYLKEKDKEDKHLSMKTSSSKKVTQFTNNSKYKRFLKEKTEYLNRKFSKLNSTNRISKVPNIIKRKKVLPEILSCERGLNAPTALIKKNEPYGRSHEVELEPSNRNIGEKKKERINDASLEENHKSMTELYFEDDIILLNDTEYELNLKRAQSKGNATVANPNTTEISKAHVRSKADFTDGSDLDTLRTDLNKNENTKSNTTEISKAPVRREAEFRNGTDLDTLRTDLNKNEDYNRYEELGIEVKQVRPVKSTAREHLNDEALEDNHKSITELYFEDDIILLNDTEYELNLKRAQSKGNATVTNQNTTEISKATVRSKAEFTDGTDLDTLRTDINKNENYSVTKSNTTEIFKAPVRRKAEFTDGTDLDTLRTIQQYNTINKNENYNVTKSNTTEISKAPVRREAEITEGTDRTDLDTLRTDLKKNEDYNRNEELGIEVKQSRPVKSSSRGSTKPTAKRYASMEVVRKLRSNMALILKNSTITPFKRILYGKSYCIYCKTIFPSFEELKTHVNDVHISMDLNDIGAAIIQPKMLIKADISDISCKLCGDSFGNIEELVKHLIEIHNKLYYDVKFMPSHGINGFDLSGGTLKCNTCKKEFAFFQALSKHMDEHSANYPCDICSKSFFTDLRMQKHMSKTHKNAGIVCKICKEPLKDIKAKRYHMRTKHSDKPLFKCVECLLTFPRYNLKLKHLSDVHSVKFPSLCCEFCNRTFASSNYLNSHINSVHLKSEEFICDICSRCFYKKILLQNHLVVHFGLKTFVCHVCGMKFKRNQSLKSHMSLHFGTRDHVCNYCGAGFLKKYTLRKHLKTHDKIKYPCDLCDAIFRQESHLKNHTDKVHCRIRVEKFVTI